MGNFAELKHIEKSYGAEQVLRGVSLDINEGEFFFLLGPSGCGKTTLLRIMSGLMEPDQGTIWLRGTNITQVPAHKRDINTVFQNYALFPHMNVFDNVAFGLRMKKTAENRVREKVMETLKLVDLAGFGARMPSQMSGGQMQRVALARAVVNEPAILLLDEPLGALDVKLRKQMQLELRRIQRQLGTTFICVTHDQEEALTLGDRIAVMNKGQFEQVGDATSLYNSPESYYVCDFLGECNFIRNVTVSSARNTSKFATAHADGIDIKIPLNPEQHITPTQLVTVGVRPEKLRISTSEGDTDSERNKICLRINERIFNGAHYTLMGSTESGLEVRFTMLNTMDNLMPDSGEMVWVSWRIADSIVLVR